MRFGLDERVLSLILEVLSSHEWIERAVLFGSRARGDYKKTSDIDIAIYADRNVRAELNQLREQLEELPIIFNIDIVEVSTLQNDKLIHHIEEDGLPIYCK